MSKPPIYFKDSAEFKWPEDKFFYLVTKDGLFQCRNHPFFKSCVKAKTISGLQPHKESLESNYPIIPRSLMQRVAGFFGYIADKHDTEAIVLLAYNTQTKAVEIVCPEQWVESWPSSINPGKMYSAMDVKYKVPTLPPNLIQIGDIHSHVNMTAYHSPVDTGDEEKRPGLHIVIGRLNQEPPDMCASVVADGERFTMKMEDVIEDYDAREDFPEEWLEKFSIKKLKESPWKHTTSWKSDKDTVKHDSYTGWWKGQGRGDYND